MQSPATHTPPPGFAAVPRHAGSHCFTLQSGPPQPTLQTHLADPKPTGFPPGPSRAFVTLQAPWPEHGLPAGEQTGSEQSIPAQPAAQAHLRSAGLHDPCSGPEQARPPWDLCAAGHICFSHAGPAKLGAHAHTPVRVLQLPWPVQLVAMSPGQRSGARGWGGARVNREDAGEAVTGRTKVTRGACEVCEAKARAVDAVAVSAAAQRTLGLCHCETRKGDGKHVKEGDDSEHRNTHLTILIASNPRPGCGWQDGDGQ